MMSCAALDAFPALCRAVRHTLAIVALGTVLVTVAAKPIAAADGAGTIIVFDGSGSMWGKMPGEKETKLVAAREAVRRGLAKIPAQSRIGLASFGHRRKADCSDTEVIRSPEPLEVERIMEPLEGLNPRGKGPLVAAMRQAAADLGKTPGPAALIVIHDDLDNCSQDPCAAATDIAKANPKLAVHVVSIGLSKADAQRMACAPKTTGGRHFDVQDGTALGAAVEEALRLANNDAVATPQAAPTPVAAAPAAAPKPTEETEGPPALKLSASLGKGGPGVIVPLAWKVTAVSGGTAPIAAIRAPTLDLAVPAGSYVVEVQHGLARASETLEVKAKGATRRVIAFEAGAVRLSAHLQKGTAALDQAVFSIAEPTPSGAQPSGRIVWTGGSDSPPVFLPTGNWRVVAEAGKMRAERQVTISPGAMLDEQLAFGAGRLRLKAVDREGGQALERVTFRISEDDADSPDGRREVARSTAPEPDFILVPGTYYVTASQGASITRERVLVNSGDEVERTLVLPVGRLALQSKFAGAASLLQANVSYRLERLDQTQEPLRVNTPSARIELPAGRYRVESTLGAQNARIVREIDLKAGATSTLSFDHVASTVQLKLAAGRATSTGEVMWSVRDTQDRTIWQSLQTGPRAYLLPGRYRIVAETRDRRGVAEIEVKTGEVKVIEVPLE